MKKIVILILCIVSILYVSNNSNNNIKIPDDAIRFRILANSNSPRDQKIKEDIKEKLEKDLYTVLKNSKSVEESRKLLNDNMDVFDNTLKEETKTLEYSYKINYGLNYFPEKEYKGITYDEGYYESLYVTLGSGEGDNFWCVLFPPLCIMEGTQENTDEAQYKFFVKELIEKYF